MSHREAVFLAALVQLTAFVVAGLRQAYTRRIERLRAAAGCPWQVDVRPTWWGVDVGMVLVDTWTGSVREEHLLTRLYQDRPDFAAAVQVSAADAGTAAYAANSALVAVPGAAPHGAPSHT